MTQSKNGSMVVMNYVYKGNGEQVRKCPSTTNIYSLYDEAGHWLADYSNATTPTQQVIWMGDLPVGLLVGSGASQVLYYIEPDALGTPRVIVDRTRGANGTAIWNWPLEGEAFGNTVPNQNPDGDANQFVFNMRFPGQRYDSASGLNYNYFRDYGPSIGRYIQSDPIGLAGGVSTYGYVSGAPLSAIDRFGLDDFECYGDGRLVFGCNPPKPPCDGECAEYSYSYVMSRDDADSYNVGAGHAGTFVCTLTGLAASRFGGEVGGLASGYACDTGWTQFTPTAHKGDVKHVTVRVCRDSNADGGYRTEIKSRVDFH